MKLGSFQQKKNFQNWSILRKNIGEQTLKDKHIQTTT